MINVAKLLKDAPKGTKLYSPLFGEVELIGVNNDFTKIRVIYHQCFPKDFLSDGRYLDFQDAECLLFPSKDCRTWEGWKLPFEPKFKVGDWIINKFRDICLITDIDLESGYYFCESNRFGNTDGDIDLTDKAFHLWSIEDAKDGDVLTDGKKIVIFNKFEEPTRKQRIMAYAGLDLSGKLQITEETKDSWRLASDRIMPSTNEQRDLLFQKIKEEGYQWDADKKELRKIKHYCISNFHAGMPVLVRDGDSDDDEWTYTLFSHYNNNRGTYKFSASGDVFHQCIPFKGNEHLLGTTDMCDEQYINW